MTADFLFQFANTFVLPFWLLLLVYPQWKHRDVTIYSAVALLALMYGYFVLLGPPMNLSDFGTLNGVMSLFTIPEAVLVGWIHYLAFDLLIGNWIVNQARKLNVRHIWVVPCLFFTFMFGPIGYLLFMLLKITRIGRTH